MKLIVWSPGKNCQNYVSSNLISILTQTYKNFVHVVVDDCSSDKTSEIIDNFKHDKMIVHRNENNQGWLKNAVDFLDPIVENDDIIVSVDLDDWLAHNRVLEYINFIYETTPAWITYGSLVTCHPNGQHEWEPNHKYDNEVWKDRNFRKRLNYFSHLRTFRGFLWKAILKNDLKCYNGKYEKFSSDVAYSLPILDMTPSERVIHLDDPLYFYNFKNPINDSKINMMEQRKQGDWFRSRPTYPLLDPDTLELREEPSSVETRVKSNKRVKFPANIRM